VADEIRRIDYYYVTVPDKPGEGSRILTALHQAGINLLGVSAFPNAARKSQTAHCLRCHGPSGFLIR
jgi:hypothetical protein